MIDIRFEFEAKIEELLILRNQLKYRHEKSEYGSYLVKKIFTSRYAMQIIWDKLMEYVNLKHPLCYSDALIQLDNLYKLTISDIVSDKIDLWLETNPYEWVGAIQYIGFIDLIQECIKGNKKAREEIEFSYLYYTLCDLCTLKWAAICASGLSKYDAVTSITGFLIEKIPLDDYKVLSNGLGELYVSKFLEQFYTPLP